jgi:ribosome maturation factor RimP
MEKQHLIEKFEEIVKAQGYLLIDLILRGDHNIRIIEVYIDSEKGIDSTDCANVSRALDQLIESQNLVDCRFRLDVSSPGVDRPLKYLIQFKKHVNRKFDLTFIEDEAEKNIIAKLSRIEDENLFFNDKNSEYKINFNKIKTAKVIISF